MRASAAQIAARVGLDRKTRAKQLAELPWADLEARVNEATDENKRATQASIVRELAAAGTNSNGKHEPSGNAAGDVRDWPAILRWAAKKKRVSSEELKEKFGITQKILYQRFNSMELGRGYLVSKADDGDYLVSRAAHFAWTGDEDEVNIRAVLKKIHAMAAQAWARERANTSASWSKEERSDFLSEIIRMTKNLC